MAPITSSLAMPDFGLRPEDVKYFHLDTVIQGRGPNRLKYLDLESRHVLSGTSVPYISTAFRHLERLNAARGPLFDITDQPLNAIGMVGWKPSSTPVVEEKKKLPKLIQPVAIVDEEEVPPSPREVVPHRSAGYGPAHQKRKLSVPDRSRSASPQQRPVTPAHDFDKYARYERNRKDSITRYGTRWGDFGYESGSPSPTYDRPPHRTQGLSSTPSRPSSRNVGDYQYSTDRPRDELNVKTDIPYRTHGYGSYHERRQYELSPHSVGSDYTSGSETSSPTPSPRNADEVLLLAYHSKGRLPRLNRTTWIQ